jgi:4-methylaminobutanoate oxidase (formaldehyde-forming)
VSFEKEGGFRGRDALLAQREQPLRRRLVVFALEDPDAFVFGDEPLWRDGELVGRLTSGAYGHTLGRAIGLGYVTHAGGVDERFLAAARWEVEIACERFAAGAQLSPPYDPKSLRVRG